MLFPSHFIVIACVAPLAGARIEIVLSCVDNVQQEVAPLAGARIEMQEGNQAEFDRRGRSPRGSED